MVAACTDYASSLTYQPYKPQKSEQYVTTGHSAPGLTSYDTPLMIEPQGQWAYPSSEPQSIGYIGRLARHM